MYSQRGHRNQCGHARGQLGFLGQRCRWSNHSACGAGDIPISAILGGANKMFTIGCRPHGLQAFPLVSMVDFRKSPYCSQRFATERTESQQKALMPTLLYVQWQLRAFLMQTMGEPLRNHYNHYSHYSRRKSEAITRESGNNTRIRGDLQRRKPAPQTTYGLECISLSAELSNHSISFLGGPPSFVFGSRRALQAET